MPDRSGLVKRYIRFTQKLADSCATRHRVNPRFGDQVIDSTMSFLGNAEDFSTAMEFAS